eukprot:Colp12_sorted_trinity150504_noHs@5115
MASVGKCRNCTKTVYQLEAARAGPPGKEIVFHKSCFKCDQPGCTWVLNTGNYTFWEGGVYCKAHYPGSGASYGGHVQNKQDIGSQSIQTALNAPKAQDP